MINWWDSETDEVKEVKALARHMCKSFAVSPDDMCIGYLPFELQTSSGPAYMIPNSALRPFWTFHIAIAKHAIELRDQMAVEAVVQTIEPEPVTTFTDDEKWRVDRGLDVEPD